MKRGRMHPKTIDWVIMGVYFACVLGVGYALKRYMKTSTDYFLSGRSITAWITGLASANLGAQEVIGSDPALYQRSLGININLWWGLALLVFGVTMLLLSWRKSAATHSAAAPTDTRLSEANARRPAH